ncbi:MAG: lactate racemase domain-containing protein, partial [Gaiella sp.]
MQRVALVAGSKVLSVGLPDGAELLVPPPPLDPIRDVGAAVTEALRYPLTGPPLAEAVTRGARATVVVGPPVLPLPGVPEDPRRDALAAVLDALVAAGVPAERHTLLFAGGLERRPGRRELEGLLRPGRARDFRGSVVVHDCEADDLVRLGEAEGVALRCHPSLISTDLVVVVAAAETVLHGTPGTLLGACSAGAQRAASAESLLEPRSSRGWRLGAAVEAALASRVPVVGVSLVLDLPRITGRFEGYPGDAQARRAALRSPLRRLLNAAPATVRSAMLQGLSRSLSVVSVLAGRPGTAHAEALVRGTALRGIRVEAPFDTLVVPVPWKTAHHPRTPVDPVGAAGIGLGLALGLWRNEHPLADGGTVVLLHPLATAAHAPLPGPARDVLEALRRGPDVARLREAEALAARDPRALDAYRGGRLPHPRLPFADWDTCAPTLRRAGRVVVAGCRDASTARALGFVPSHNAATALEMAAGVAPEGARVGVVLAPP